MGPILALNRREKEGCIFVTSEFWELQVSMKTHTERKYEYLLKKNWHGNETRYVILEGTVLFCFCNVKQEHRGCM